MELTIDEALKKGVDAHKAGQAQEADRLYTAILKAQPKHPDANHNMGVLAVGIGKIQEALPFFEAALEANSKIAQFWLSYIDALIKLGKVDDAKSVLDQAKEKGAKGDAFDRFEAAVKELNTSETDPTLKTDKPIPSEANILDSLKVDQAFRLAQKKSKEGLMAEAQSICQQILAKFPESRKAKDLLKMLSSGNAPKVSKKYAEAYYNMGNTLKDKGELEAAIDSYKHAIKIKPKYAEAHYNMGVALHDMGNLEVAIESYLKVLEIKPNNEVAKFSLIQILTSYKPQKDFTHPLIKADEKIGKISVSYEKSKLISDSEIRNLYSDCLQTVRDHQIQIDWILSQTYRKNSTLNCHRHMKIFNERNVIPEFCFGCYKVQVEPRTVLELIKLFVVFDKLSLDNDNLRKCMVELRVGVAGFYKGLIYCSSLKEANKISDYLTRLVRENIGLGIPVLVKRGCSEYSISYPQYKEINNFGPQLMNYNEEWRPIEVKHDAKYPTSKENRMPQCLDGLSLSDFLIMQNWLVYAQEIGDDSHKAVTSDLVNSIFIVQEAKARAEKSVRWSR